MTDKSGAVVPNVTITVTDISKGISVSVKSNESGLFRVQHLIPDTYRVQAESQGYSKTLVDNVVVYADTAPEVDIQLTVGAVSNTVTVTDEAPLLETDRAEVSTILDERAVENLPNFNRNFTAFELLTPGTSYIGWGPGEAGDNPQRSEAIEVDGQLPFATGYELDGTDNQEPIDGVAIINPNADAISEIKVNAQNYDAEFGKAVAGLVTVQTKSGSNAFHGTAFDYRRSDAQQARDPFANQSINPLTGRYLASTLHNQFGGTVGGPIKKDKIFFFFDYQGQREKTGGAGLTTVPTATALSTCTSGGTCDLSDYLAFGEQVYKPVYLDQSTNANNTPYLNNQIPASDLSAAAVNYFKLLPAPNVAGAGLINNYSYNGSGIYNNNQYDVRGDDKLTSKLHVFGRYTRFSGALSGPSQLGAAGGGSIGPIAGTDAFHYNSIASGGDYLLTAKWLTDFRFAYYSIYNNTVAQNSNEALGNELGIPNANGTPLSLYGGLPQFNITAPAATGANGGGNLEYGQNTNPSLEQISQLQFVNNWSHTIGNHNIKFGVDYRYGKAWLVSVESNALRSGTYFANNTRTSGVTGSVQSTGLGFATFLIGDATMFWRTETANVNAQSRQNRIFSYLQDQWRATPKISINYGVRWEIYSPETVTAPGAGGLLDLQTGNVNITGVGQVNSAANVQNNLGMFAPRLGVTYQVLPKTVIRAGYGLAFGQGWAGDSFGEDMTGSFPSQIQQNVVPLSNESFGADFNLTKAETLSNGVTVVPAGPPSYTFPATPSSGLYQLPNGIYQDTRTTKVRLPSVNGYNVTVQQELSPTATFQVAFVGAQAYHNMFDSSPTFNTNEETLAGFETINPNTGVDYTAAERSPYYDGTAQSQLGVKFGKPFGWTQRIDYAINAATENYSALQAVFVKRISSGLSFTSNYTWSHAISHEAYQFLLNPAVGRGNSYYNRRHAFVWAGDYDLPFGKGKPIGSNLSHAAQEIIGGFQLNAAFSWQGGIPFTACYNEIGLDNDVAAADGCGPSFVNHVPGTKIDLHKAKFDPVGDDVPFMPESPYPLTPPGTADNSWGPWARPAAGTWGNLGRDALWGPGLVNVDSSLTKTIDLHEGYKLQFLLQAYNVFNHANLGDPNSCVDCGGNAGTIQSTLQSQFDGTTMRRLQFAARFSF
ncbi:MAG: TonB-dependent receptor [Terracidiphilus sp.]